MIALVAALTVAAATVSAVTGPVEAGVGARIRQSAAAAQAFQGPLDGTWILRDQGSHPLYVLQITDPALGAGPLDGAWRDAGAPALAGGAAAITRLGDQLIIKLMDVAGGSATVIRLRRRDASHWTGWATRDGRQRPVRLSRRR